MADEIAVARRARIEADDLAMLDAIDEFEKAARLAQYVAQVTSPEHLAVSLRIGERAGLMREKASAAIAINAAATIVLKTHTELVRASALNRALGAEVRRLRALLAAEVEKRKPPVRRFRRLERERDVG